MSSCTLKTNSKNLATLLPEKVGPITTGPLRSIHNADTEDTRLSMNVHKEKQCAVCQTAAISRGEPIINKPLLPSKHCGVPKHLHETLKELIRLYKEEGPTVVLGRNKSPHPDTEDGDGAPPGEQPRLETTSEIPVLKNKCPYSGDSGDEVGTPPEKQPRLEPTSEIPMPNKHPHPDNTEGEDGAPPPKKPRLEVTSGTLWPDTPEKTTTGVGEEGKQGPGKPLSVKMFNGLVVSKDSINTSSVWKGFNKNKDEKENQDR